MRALHYPPEGSRSYGPRRPLLCFDPGYFAYASDTIVAFVMIETRRGVDCLDAILSVNGFDGVFIGPNDLAIDHGRAPHSDATDSSLAQIIASVARRTKAAGRRTGIFCQDEQVAKLRARDGFDMVTISPDLALLGRGARQACAIARGVATGEENQ